MQASEWFLHHCEGRLCRECGRCDECNHDVWCMEGLAERDAAYNNWLYEQAEMARWDR